MTIKRTPDWEAIESAYRAGTPSLRTIAEKHGITEGAIRKRANKEKWSRNLAAKVLQATQDKLVRMEVRKQNMRTDEEIIESESDLRAELVRVHRVNLAQWRGITDKLSDALLGVDVTAENASDFARSLNAGVDAQLKVIKGERQAYGLDLDDGNKVVDSLSALMDDLTRDA